MGFSSSIHPFWKWIWRALCMLLAAPLVLFPFAMIALVLIEIFIVPHLYHI